MILETCSDLDILTVMAYIKSIMLLIEIAGPIVVIIMGSVDLVKAVMASSQENIQKNMHRLPGRILICCCLFLIPAIIMFVVDNVDATNEVTACLQKANLSEIQVAYNELALEAVETAEKDQTYGACNDAYAAIDKVSDASLKKTLKERIDAVQQAVAANNKVTLPSQDTDPSDGTGDGTGNSSTSSSKIVDYAEKYVGVKYVWGGTSLSSGVDCSGFTRAVFSNFGIDLPHNANSQSKVNGQTISSLSDAKPGDLLFFDWGNDGEYDHVAIYIGNGKKIHASGNQDCGQSTISSACKVTIDSNNMSSVKLIKRVTN